MSESQNSYVHPDHWSKSHRDLIAHLRAQPLPGVDTDDEALIALTIEQARLLLVTAGGLLGLTLTQVLGTNKSICWLPIYIEIPSLSVALTLGWIGLILGGMLRSQRVIRRYDIYNAHLDAHLQAEARKQSIDLSRFDQKFDTAFVPERATQRNMRWLQFLAAGFTSLGIVAAAAAAIGTVAPDRCVGGVYPARVLAGQHR